MTLGFLVVIAGVALAADDSSKEDLKRLQGEWLLVSFKKEDEELPPQASKARMAVEGERGVYKSDVGE